MSTESNPGYSGEETTVKAQALETPPAETNPEVKKNSSCEEVKRGAKEKEVEVTVQKLNSRLLFDILRLSLNQDGSEDKDISELVSEYLNKESQETLEIDLDQETVLDLKKLLAELPKRIKSDVEMSEDQINKIVEYISVPIMNGHISAKDVFTIVQSIKITATNQNSNLQGYEGCMFYNPQNGTIVISENILDEFSETTAKGEQKSNQGLDVEHMLIHEVSHGISEHMFRGEEAETLFSQADKVLLQAEEARGSQSFHIETVLDAIQPDKIKEDYKIFIDNNPEMADSVTLETFETERRALAAKEIITDYTAIYLQSNGDFDDFSRVCISKSDHEKLLAYLEIDATEDDNLEQIISETMTSKNKSETLKKYPKLKKLFDNYAGFFSIIKKSLIRGEITGETQASDDNEEMINTTLRHNLDQARNFPSEKNNQNQSSALHDVKTLFAVFGDELDFLTK